MRTGYVPARPVAGIDPDELPLFLTVAQAAEVVGLSLSSAYDACQRGELPTVRFGRRLRVPRHALLNLGREDESS